MWYSLCTVGLNERLKCAVQTNQVPTSYRRCMTLYVHAPNTEWKPNNNKLGILKIKHYKKQLIGHYNYNNNRFGSVISMIFSQSINKVCRFSCQILLSCQVKRRGAHDRVTTRPHVHKYILTSCWDLHCQSHQPCYQPTPVWESTTKG